MIEHYALEVYFCRILQKNNFYQKQQEDDRILGVEKGKKNLKQKETSGQPENKCLFIIWKYAI